MSKPTAMLNKRINICLLSTALLLVVFGCETSAEGDNSAPPPAHTEVQELEGETERRFSQKQEHRILEERNILDYDALSEDNPSPTENDMDYTDAVVFALEHYEQAQGVKLENANAYANYRGNLDGDNPSFLILFKNLDGSLLSSVRVNSITGELIGFE